jgi:hypothetical protein
MPFRHSVKNKLQNKTASMLVFVAKSWSHRAIPKIGESPSAIYVKHACLQGFDDWKGSKIHVYVAREHNTCSRFRSQES